MLPPEIRQLRALQYLNLSGNELTVLPPEIGQLTALQGLYLYTNKLAMLPPEIGRLTALQNLGLNGNHLTVLPPEIGQLAALQALYLDHNQLAVLPAEVGRLTALENLSIKSNQLVMLPQSLGNCASLSNLSIDMNPLRPHNVDDIKKAWHELKVNYLGYFQRKAALNRFSGREGQLEVSTTLRQHIVEFESNLVLSTLSEVEKQILEESVNPAAQTQKPAAAFTLPDTGKKPETDDTITVQRKAALQNELREIKINAEEAVRAVSASLRDKAVAKQDDFQQKNKSAGEKKSGLVEGYIATESATGETFILKQFFKKSANLNTKQLEQRGDGVREVIAASMYQFLLYDRAPKEQLVTPDTKHSDSLYVRSKFFKDEEIKELSQFSGGYANSLGKAGSLELAELRRIKGFEKVIAACVILGESDYHPGNIMVQQDDTVTKIDHGKSFTMFGCDFKEMVLLLDKVFRTCDYTRVIEAGYLMFSIEKYSASINQMLLQLTEDQLNAIVDQRVSELRKYDFEPDAVKPILSDQSLDNKTKEERIQQEWEAFGQQYKTDMEKNLKNMKEIAAQLEIIAKFSNVDDTFKNGGWIKAFAESPEQDPIKYAIMHNIKIDGMDPTEYGKKKANDTVKIHFSGTKLR